ncbi:hypothetical protein S40285_10949, partial [Stachybotrys chlorohalonatus IBT 40285]
AKG